MSLRATAATVAALTFTAGTAAVAVPASAQQFDEPARSAAEWLVDQADGAYWGSPDAVDYSATLDAVYALLAAGAGTEQIADTTAWLTEPGNATPYVGDADTGYNAGALGKVLLAVEAAGGDGGDVGGDDLESALRGLEGDDGFFAGSTVAQQAFAVLGLAYTDDGAPESAVSALAAEQCEHGGFHWSSHGGDGCGVDPDTTGMVVSALLAAGRDDVAETALDWLETQQTDDGGFHNGAPTEPWSSLNTMSTGLAAQALRGGGHAAAADAAAEFIESTQFDDGGIPWLPADTSPNLWATAQATLGLAPDGLHSLAPPDDGDPEPTEPTDAPTSPDATGPGRGDDGDGDGDTDPATGAPNAQQRLPVTGTGLGVPLAAGAALLAVGAILMLAARRRRIEEAS